MSSPVAQLFTVIKKRIITMATGASIRFDFSKTRNVSQECSPWTDKLLELFSLLGNIFTCFSLQKVLLHASHFDWLHEHRSTTPQKAGGAEGSYCLE